jgi:hypothetical protein
MKGIEGKFALCFQGGMAKRSIRLRPEDEAQQFLHEDKPGFQCRFINDYIGECNVYL